MGFSLFLVSAMFGRFSASLGWARPVWGVSGWFPFTYGWAVTSALRAAREHAPLGVWLPGVVALVAYAVSGCPVTVPVGYGCGVSLFLAGRFLARARLFGVVGMLLCVTCVSVRSLRCARLAVCLSAVSCSVACCWFVAVCFVWRLLCGCAFRERACVYCDMVHVGLCGRAFDGDRDCRLFFTV